MTKKSSHVFFPVSTFIEYGYILTPLPWQVEGEEFGRALQLLCK